MSSVLERFIEEHPDPAGGGGKPEKLYQGKVRDTYLGEEPGTMVVLTTNRISVFDVVLPQLIPGKGQVLNHMTAHWLTQTPIAEIIPNHLIAAEPAAAPSWIDNREADQTMTVRKLDMLPVEAIVRGYITGSGWKDYQRTGGISGIDLPPGMQEMQQFPEPIFTPSTKAVVGHDQNIDFEGMVGLLGGDRRLANRLRIKALELYAAGAAYALDRGIILVDTKFEFGIDPATGELTLADEVLTPDSSRYVAAETYEVGQPPLSMDKQFVRDYYESIGWDKKPPAPPMPTEIIQGTIERYREISQRLTGINPMER